MSFFFKKQGKPVNAGSGISLNTLHRLGCRGCPLNDSACKSPKMAPTGSNDPIVYVLGANPSRTDDKRGSQLNGEEGRIVKRNIPEEFKENDEYLRYNNIVRTHKADGPLGWQEIESCRGSIIKDIEETKPTIILGLGDKVLNWVLKENSIFMWRGRIIPVKIGNHTCWFQATFDPETLINKSTKYRPPLDTEEGRMFKRDMDQLFNNKIEVLEPAVIEDPKDIRKFTRLVTGNNGKPDLDKLIKFTNEAIKEKVLAIDIETNGFRPYAIGAKILSISVTTKRETVAFAVDHSRSMWSKEQRKLLDELIKKILFSKAIKVAHSLQFEQEWFAYFYGLDLLRASPWDDTMAQAYTLDERKSVLSLDKLCLQYFGFNLKSVSDIDVSNLDNFPVEDVLQYNALDSKYTYELYFKQLKRLKEEGLLGVAREATRRIPTIVLTQLKGINIDQKRVSEFQKYLSKEIKRIEFEIEVNKAVKLYTKKYGDFNPGSPKQVAMLYGNILHRKEVITERGGLSANENILASINDALSKLILEHRSYSKLKSTYVDVFEYGKGENIHPDGKAHTTLNSAFTSTGRLSSDSPNMQNIPKRKNSWVRKEFVPSNGHVLVAVDYGQIEARVIGMASKDKFLVKALWENYDIHMEWAERLSKDCPRSMNLVKSLPEEKQMKELRQLAKNKLVFPAFFGAQPRSIASYLSLPENDMSKILTKFWDTFEGVLEWQEKLLKFYKENGYVECLTGRRRHAPISPNKIINMPIQGTASDIVVDSMNRLSEYALENNKMQFQPILNIHDDLTYDLPVDTLDNDLDFIINKMITVPFDFVNVPISVEVMCGENNWYEMEEIGVFASND